MYIEGKGGYSPSKINLNHKNAANSGYLSSKSDWRNVEITYYIKVDSPHVDIIDTYVRGGDIASGTKCEAVGYIGTLSYSGGVQFSKQQNTSARYNTTSKLPVSNIKGRWVGFKFCCYDDGKNNSPVYLEIYIDDGESNNWKLVANYTDAEGWGSAGGACGSDFADKKLSWTGPLVMLAFHNTSSIELKKISVREINALGGQFNEGGSNPTGGASNGGSGSTGSGGGGSGNGSAIVNHNSCTQVNTVSNVSSSGKGGSNSGGETGSGGDSGNTAVNNSSNNTPQSTPTTAPSTSTGSTDSYGVKMLYATGPKRNDPKPNVRNDGTRFDFTGLGSSYASIEVTGYFRGGSTYNDEVACKTGGGGHSDGKSPKCYIVAWDTESGAMRLRYENKHPQTDTHTNGPGQGPGGGVGFTNRWVGYKSIKRNQSSGVLLEGWQDQGSNSGNTPANAWKLIGKWVDTKLNWRTPPSDHQETWRIDKNGGADDLNSKWMSIAQINDGDSTTPGTGGGTSPGSQTGSDGTTDSNQCSCGAGTGSSSEPSGSSGSNSGSNQSCSGDGSGNNDPNGDSGNADTTITEPPPIVTFSKDFVFMHNIMTESDNSCTIGFPKEEKDLESIYNAEADILTYQDLGYATANQQVGLYVANTYSILFDKVIRKVTVNALKRTVDEALDTCSGTISLKIISVLDGKVKQTFKEEATGDVDFDVGAIDVNDQALTWLPVLGTDEVEYQCKVGDMLVLDYFDQSADIDKCIKVKHTKTDKVDGYNTHMVVKLITGYSFILKDFDAAFNIFI